MQIEAEADNAPVELQIDGFTEAITIPYAGIIAEIWVVKGNDGIGYSIILSDDGIYYRDSRSGAKTASVHIQGSSTPCFVDTNYAVFEK